MNGRILNNAEDVLAFCGRVKTEKKSNPWKNFSTTWDTSQMLLPLPLGISLAQCLTEKPIYILPYFTQQLNVLYIALALEFKLSTHDITVDQLEGMFKVYVDEVGGKSCAHLLTGRSCPLLPHVESTCIECSCELPGRRGETKVWVL